MVLVKPLVLNGDNGVDHMLGNILVVNPDTVFIAVEGHVFGVVSAFIQCINKAGIL